MRIDFNVAGADRKALVTAMGEILEARPKYLGMPTAAYEVDYFRVDKNGVVEFDDSADSEEIENLLERLSEKGFTAAEMPPTAAGDEAKEVSGDEPDEPQGESVGLTVAVPLDEVRVGNLTALLEAKGSLIKRALGIDGLPIEVGEEKISFPWFFELPDADTVQAYTHFISALCKMSREQKRITAKEKTVDNEKYAFRCFLLRLGFIGTEYKGERKILLKNLSGSSAFKSGAKKEAGSSEVSK